MFKIRDCLLLAFMSPNSKSTLPVFLCASYISWFLLLSWCPWDVSLYPLMQSLAFSCRLNSLWAWGLVQLFFSLYLSDLPVRHNQFRPCFTINILKFNLITVTIWHFKIILTFKITSSLGSMNQSYLKDLIPVLDKIQNILETGLNSMFKNGKPWNGSPFNLIS